MIVPYGVDFIKDNKVNVEEDAIKNLLPDIWSYAEKIGDKYHICQLIADGKTEKEIAEICKITQQTVNETKLRLFKKLKKIIEKKSLKILKKCLLNSLFFRLISEGVI